MSENRKDYNGMNAGIVIGKNDPLFEAFSFAVAARGKDPARCHMNGLRIARTDGRLSLVSTDGKRMHWVEDREGGIEAGLKAAGIDTESLIGHTFSVMKSADTVVVGREIEGQFPGWEKLLDKDWKAASGVEFTKGEKYADGVYQLYRLGYAVKADHLADIREASRGWYAGQQGSPIRFEAVLNGLAYTVLTMPMNWGDPMKGILEEAEAAKRKVKTLENRLTELRKEMKAVKAGLVIEYKETEYARKAREKEWPKAEVPAIEYKPEAEGPAMDKAETELDFTPLGRHH